MSRNRKSKGALSFFRLTATAHGSRASGLRSSSDEAALPHRSRKLEAGAAAAVLQGRFNVNAGEIRVIMGGRAPVSTLCVICSACTSRAVERVARRRCRQRQRARMLAVRRQIGVSFQGGALLTSMSVGDSVALPLREHTKLDENTIRIESHQARGRQSQQLPGPDAEPAFRWNDQARGLARAIVDRMRAAVRDEPRRTVGRFGRTRRADPAPARRAR